MLSKFAMEHETDLLRYAAIKREDLAETRHLVETMGLDPTATPSWRAMPVVHSACFNGCFEIVQYFVSEREINVESVDPDGDTLLHCACLGGRRSFRVVRYLVEKAGSNIEATNYAKLSPLHHACSRGRSDLVKYLVEEGGANVNAEDSMGKTPLCHAFERESGKDAVRFLIPRSSRIDALTLHMAWNGKYPTDIKLQLLDFYARRELHLPENYFSRYPLHAALYSPLPSEAAYLETIRNLPTRVLSILDCDDRFPIHLALADALRAEAITPELVLVLVNLEPRQACSRDPMSGLSPFEAVALKWSNKPRGLDLLFQLFRHNPVEVLKRRLEASALNHAKAS
uniref:Uncharacterized protein n=1 Tax=Grammatophora oceanica TaxID=210454 RepID=A0A7S1V0I6_9STRA|mmetsp:Transcript_29839/g.44044  ORF Transcript_29839/g.44044 Transcript_29839/m.44044 type:complete len:342 (+) Transcript_29839:62-1087(+)